MEIGILTFHFADNYGAVLQAYALKEYICELKVGSVSILNYMNDRMEHMYSINPFRSKSIKSFLKAIALYPFKLRQSVLFQDFRRSELGIDRRRISDLEHSGIDCYVVGSDQVWNRRITFGDLTYFLNGLQKEKGIYRFSYAASSDDEFAKNLLEQDIIGLLRGFNAISVRELQMQIDLQNIGITSEVVLDPVFLQSKEFWSNVSKSVKGVPQKYILYYSLRQSDELDRIVQQLNQTHDLPVIVVHPTLRRVTRCGRLLLSVGPREFLFLIQNASVIVSNSFHAFAFACIFSKHIFFDYVSGASNRIKNLIELLHLQVVKKDGIYFVDPNIYSCEDYEVYLNKSKNFLRNNLLKSVIE